MEKCRRIMMLLMKKPYREALVMEHATIWPETYDDWDLPIVPQWRRPRISISRSYGLFNVPAPTHWLRPEIKKTDAHSERLADEGRRRSRK